MRIPGLHISRPDEKGIIRYSAATPEVVVIGAMNAAPDAGFVHTSGVSTAPSAATAEIHQNGPLPETDEATRVSRRVMPGMPRMPEKMATRGNRDFLYSGGVKANEGGGAGIYPNVGALLGTAIGQEEALRSVVGWVNRLSIFRDPNSGPYTVDRSRNNPTPGFEGSWQNLFSKDRGVYLDQLDHQHLSRASLPAYYLDHPIGSFLLSYLCRDVADSWIHGGAEHQSGDNVVWWTVDTFLERDKGGKGHPATGRELAHAIFTLARGVDRKVASSADLGMLVVLAEHLWDHEIGTCFVVRPEMQGEAYPANAWTNKTGQYPHSGPLSKWVTTRTAPGVTLGFENWLLVKSLFHAAYTLRKAGMPASADSALEMAQNGAHRLCADPRHFYFVGHPDLSPQEGPNWHSWCAGQEGFEETLMELVTGNRGWWQDTPTAALPMFWE